MNSAELAEAIDRFAGSDDPAEQAAILSRAFNLDLWQQKDLELILGGGDVKTHEEGFNEGFNVGKQEGKAAVDGVKGELDRIMKAVNAAKTGIAKLDQELDSIRSYVNTAKEDIAEGENK